LGVELRSICQRQSWQLRHVSLPAFPEEANSDAIHGVFVCSAVQNSSYCSNYSKLRSVDLLCARHSASSISYAPSARGRAWREDVCRHLFGRLLGRGKNSRYMLFLMPEQGRK